MRHKIGDVYISAINDDLDDLLDKMKFVLNPKKHTIKLRFDQVNIINKIPPALGKKVRKAADGFLVELEGKDEIISEFLQRFVQDNMS